MFFSSWQLDFCKEPIHSWTLAARNFTMASQLEANSDSDISFLSDLEDHFKLPVPNELQFVDSYFQQETTTEEDTSFQSNPFPYSSPSNEENGIPEWDRLSDWIHCVCVVTFDLEIGQMIEVFHTFL